MVIFMEIPPGIISKLSELDQWLRPGGESFFERSRRKFIDVNHRFFTTAQDDIGYPILDTVGAVFQVLGEEQLSRLLDIQVLLVEAGGPELQLELGFDGITLFVGRLCCLGQLCECCAGPQCPGRQ